MTKISYWQAKAKLMVNVPEKYRMRIHWVVYDLLSVSVACGRITLKQAQDALRKDCREADGRD